MKINMKYITFILIAILSFSVVVNAAGDGKYKKVKKENFKAGDAYRMNINNFNLPLNKSGVLGDVLLNGSSGGTLDGKIFLFSGGFFMSGLSEGHKWANAVASASRIQDYNPGTYAIPSTDNRVQLYVVSAKDGDFAPSWNDWKDAVALGANFYDGDGDGVYNPVDKNNNHKWDPNEDRPDLIGDETVWCVYSDNVDPALRSFNDVDPQGIEIRQTVFGFNSKGVTGNMVFVRYELLNTGKYYNSIDSVYFSVWADPDLGDPYSDLVGCDTTLNAGYVYNSGPDAIFGKNPPCFLIDFFQGPIVYVPGET
ncbi:MAG: hypothetical protein Q8933_20220, partial [Bacteroidota bacterium]|nr:hypothetical protein [Bacteroidota bacterium]